MGVRRFVEIDMFVSYPRKLVFPQFDLFPCGMMAGIIRDKLPYDLLFQERKKIIKGMKGFVGKIANDQRGNMVRFF